MILDVLPATCTKCGSAVARYEPDRIARTVRLVCRCGYDRLVYSEHRGVIIEHRERFDPRSLPRDSSVLHRYYLALVDLHPTRATTAEVARRIPDLPRKTASNCLGVLCSRGITTRVSHRRGLPGGSVWRLADETCKYLGLSPGPPRNPE